LRLQTARDAARGRLLTSGAGLFAAAALLFTARNFALSREGQVTDCYTNVYETAWQPAACLPAWRSKATMGT
jgi:hypothetical protein